MWVVVAVAGLSAGLMAACLVGLRRELRAAPRGWQILAASGVPLALGGLGFIVRFWEPLPGPYLANARYPLGPYLNAWAVSFGFMWLAFGLIFFALALLAPRTWRLWFTLLIAWFLAWLPHGIIGLGFAAAGSNRASIELYRDWASQWPRQLGFYASGLILLGHFGLALLGFALTGRAAWRSRRPSVAA
jgi:hypothetical protein